MKELFFIFSLIIGLGIIVYLLLNNIVKNENSFKEKLDADELEELKFILDAINVAGPAVKFKLILMMGGTFFSQAFVFLINLPFYYFDTKRK